MKLRLPLWFAALLFTAIPVSASTEDAATEGAEAGKWTQDYDAAIALAKENRLPVMLKFTGSDWCGWCKIMETRVFSTDEFAEWADGRVVLVTIDRPQNESLVPVAFRERNQRLFAEYGVRGVPQYVVQDPDGSILGHLGASSSATVESFTARFEELAGDWMREKGSVPARSGAKGGEPAFSPTTDPAEIFAFQAKDASTKPLADMAGKLVELLRKRQEELAGKEKILVSQMVSAFEKAKTAAQNRGDLDGVLLFEAAAKDPASPPESDNETLRGILQTKDQAVTKLREAFEQDCARLLASASGRLDRMKTDETKKGHIELAKEIADYQKKVQDVLDRCRKPEADGAAASNRPSSAERPTASGAPASSTDIKGTSRNISIPVDKENGANLGHFEKGEILVLQYLSGTYRPYRGSARTVNPDQRSEYYYSSEGSPILEGPLSSPHRRAYTLPKETAKKPFAFSIPEGGHFILKCYAGNYSQGKVTYRMTKLNVLEAKEFEKSGDKKAFQWP